MSLYIKLIIKACSRKKFHELAGCFVLEFVINVSVVNLFSNAYVMNAGLHTCFAFVVFL